MIDVFHCNSKHTEEIYRRFLPKIATDVVPITHKGINDKRRIKTFSNDCLNICFVGSTAQYKGLPMLIDILKTIDERKWKLFVWGGKVGHDVTLPIYYRGAFSNAMLEEVYGNTDLVVVPSIWDETFSFVTLEALSFGTPVLVSTHVGAQDVVRRYSPHFIYSTKEELKSLLAKIMNDRTPLKDYNQQIVSQPWAYTMEGHAKNMIELYSKELHKSNKES